MKLPSVQRINREDIQEAPEWITKLLTPLNSLLLDFYNAMNKNLVVGENVQGEFREFTITAGAAETDNTFQFTLSTKTIPRNVSIAQATEVVSPRAPITTAVSISWYHDAGTVKIDAIAGLTSGKKYFFRVLVI